MLCPFLLAALFTQTITAAPPAVTPLIESNSARQPLLSVSWGTHAAWGLVLYDVLSAIALGYLWMSGKLDEVLGTYRWRQGDRRPHEARQNGERHVRAMRRVGIL